MSGAPLRLGVTPPDRIDHLSVAERRAALEAIADEGLDHVFFADHVSFHTGAGMDGMIQAAALSQLTDRLTVYVGVYLLALRHPVTVARQLSTLSEYAPGRVVFGVGVGGEDRHEMEVCGIDPATRGRRTNESLDIVRALMTGEPLDHHGEFYQLDNALILPAPEPRIPIMIGGRSDAALARVAERGDGWLAVWRSADRIRDDIARIEDMAAAADRSVDFDHGLQLWCGIGPDRETARGIVARRMEGFYRIPFERFERHTPHGRPEDIAEFLRPCVDAGCRTINLMVCADSVDESTAAAGEIKRLLTT